MNFGEIYLIPRNKHNNSLLEGHWVVLLYEDRYNIYLQPFSSRMVKVFPNFSCNFCVTKGHETTYQRYKNNPRLYLDTDIISLINFNKYSFFERETFLSFKGLCKDGYFNFNNAILRGIFKYYGILTQGNQRSVLLSIRNSSEISMKEKEQIFGYYDKCKMSHSKILVAPSWH